MNTQTLNITAHQLELCIKYAPVTKDNSLWDYIVYIEIQNNVYMDNLQQEHQRKNHYNLYRAIEIFGKDFIKDICREKIYARENVDHFSYLNSLTCENFSKKFVPSYKVDEARHVNISDILELIQHTYVKRSCICPFCGGSNRNKFAVNANLFKCFSCDAKGDSISFVMKYFKTDFRGAVDMLLKLW